MDIQLSDEARDQSLKLPLSIRVRIEEVVDRLRNWPRVSGVKWLTGVWKNHARIRTGDYRVVFHLAGDDLIVVDRIAHRRDVYAD